MELDQLREEVTSWLGTPYRHWCGVKGMGCDCIHFVARVVEASGLGPFNIPWYPKDWHLHRSEELLREGILSQVTAESVQEADIQNGDITLYRFGRTMSHAAIYLDGHVYGAITNTRVERLHWDDPVLRKRLAEILRGRK
jgi:cell wall-associated NlpC family hydrolase